jgi:hypothetical protein
MLNIRHLSKTSGSWYISPCLGLIHPSYLKQDLHRCLSHELGVVSVAIRVGPDLRYYRARDGYLDD